MLSCLICLESLELEDSSDYVVCISVCGHVFHKNCVFRWCELNPTKNSCPKCRRIFDNPNQIVRLFFGSTTTTTPTTIEPSRTRVTKRSETEEEMTHQIEALLNESAICHEKMKQMLVFINENMRTIERNTGKIAGIARTGQTSGIDDPISDEQLLEDYKVRFNLKNLSVLIPRVEMCLNLNQQQQSNHNNLLHHDHEQ